jgi:hypothetical protein
MLRVLSQRNVGKIESLVSDKLSHVRLINCLAAVVDLMVGAMLFWTSLAQVIVLI